MMMMMSNVMTPSTVHAFILIVVNGIVLANVFWHILIAVCMFLLLLDPKLYDPRHHFFLMNKDWTWTRAEQTPSERQRVWRAGVVDEGEESRLTR